MPEFGCITEQGDMGLGFSTVTESEIQKTKEDLKKEWEETHKKEDIDH